MSIKLIKHQAIQLWESAKWSKLVCSFKDAFIILINNASRFFLIWLLDGALHNIDQSNKCPIWFFICCAGSDLWVGLLCSYQRVAVFTIYHSIFCMLGKRHKELNFLVFQIIANRNWLLVNLWKSFDLASFFSQ